MYRFFSGCFGLSYYTVQWSVFWLVVTYGFCQSSATALSFCTPVNAAIQVPNTKTNKLPIIVTLPEIRLRLLSEIRLPLPISDYFSGIQLRSKSICRWYIQFDSCQFKQKLEVYFSVCTWSWYSKIFGWLK